MYSIDSRYKKNSSFALQVGFIYNTMEGQRCCPLRLLNGSPINTQQHVTRILVVDVQILLPLYLVGLVFLQYRNETKRALLPNEITTMDTVRALFVRSFAPQLSMAFFDSHNVRIYIHDPNQDMFYELENLA